MNRTLCSACAINIATATRVMTHTCQRERSALASGVAGSTHRVQTSALVMQTIVRIDETSSPAALLAFVLLVEPLLQRREVLEDRARVHRLLAGQLR